MNITGSIGRINGLKLVRIMQAVATGWPHLIRKCIGVSPVQEVILRRGSTVLEICLKCPIHERKGFFYF